MITLYCLVLEDVTIDVTKGEMGVVERIRKVLEHTITQCCTCAAAKDSTIPVWYLNLNVSKELSMAMDTTGFLIKF